MYLPARIALADLKAASESEHIGQPIRIDESQLNSTIGVD